MTEVLEREKSKIEGGRDIKAIVPEIFRDWERAQGTGQRGPHRKHTDSGGGKVLETAGSECESECLQGSHTEQEARTATALKC